MLCSPQSARPQIQGKNSDGSMEDRGQSREMEKERAGEIGKQRERRERGTRAGLLFWYSTVLSSLDGVRDPLGLRGLCLSVRDSRARG